jgi:hypothetical protein
LSDNSICDAVMTGFSGDYTYGWPGGNCAYMSSDYTRLIGVQGVSATQECWAVEGLPRTDGEATHESTKPITALGQPTRVYLWTLHWWVYAGGKTRDPSTGTSHSGDWGTHEDNVFADYWRWDAANKHTYLNGSNPTGHTTETNATWKMVHSNPGGPIDDFNGPPTPW